MECGKLVQVKQTTVRKQALAMMNRKMGGAGAKGSSGTQADRLGKAMQEQKEKEVLAKRQKEIEKLKIAEEDKRAAKLYEEMVIKAEEARSSYFIRKVSDNEGMAKALDEVFGKRDRERAAKEKATLERIVKEEDARLKCVFARHPQPFLVMLTWSLW